MNSKPQFLNMIITVIASAALANAHRFVSYSGAYASAGGKAIGVLQVPVESGYPASVAIDGIVTVEAGGAVTVGSDVKSDASGRAVAVTDLKVDINTGVNYVVDTAETVDNAVLRTVLGTALDAATQAGDFIRIKLY